MPQAQLISFYSYKGGVGRSISLANVAVLLARRGYRVACIDFDLEAGGLHTIFGLETAAVRQNTILHVLAMPGAPDLQRTSVDLTSLVGGPGRLLLFPTVSEATLLAEVQSAVRDIPMLLGEIVRRIEDDFDPQFILVDSRAGFAELASAPLLKADRVVCVLRPNRQNAEGLRILLDILSNVRAAPKTFLVLSQVPDLPEAAARIAHLETLLGNRKFGCQIPYAPELALDEHVISVTAPSTTLAQSYEPIVDWLLQKAKRRAEA